MAIIPVDDTPGGYFYRLGKAAYSVNVANTYRRTTIAERTDAIDGCFNSSDQNIPAALYATRDSLRAAMGGWNSFQASMMSSLLIQMANTSVPLASKDLQTAMKLLVEQLGDASETVKANTVSVSVAIDGGNTGTTVALASIVGPDGRNQEYVLAEDITLTATTDYQSGTATTQGAETWRVTSPVAETDQLSWNWPKGSGVSASVVSNLSTGTAQKLANGDFEDWTVSNVPDQWTVVVGSAGATILRAATPYTGTYSLSIVGNSSTLIKLWQEFDDSTNGTSYKLRPNAVYAVHCWVKMSLTPAAGSLTLSLVNSAGTVVTNDQGSAQTLTKALTGVSTTWVSFGGFFQTPRVLSTAVPHYFQLATPTSISTGSTAYIDDLTMVLAGQVYAGGPFLAVFPGSVATVLNDTIVVTVANDWAGKFQAAFQTFFDMRSLGYQLASSGSPTISESLVGA